MASVTQNQAIFWQPLAAWPAESRPETLWPWLSYAGSLTEKLRAATGAAFHVQVLHEGTVPLPADDAQLLHTLPGTAAHLREVYLCGAAPCVYARTLAAAGAAHWLDRLNMQPLGDRVFADPGTQRLPIQVACLEPGHFLYHTALKRLKRDPTVLWARRSVLVAGDVRLLIYECFLDEDVR